MPISNCSNQGVTPARAKAEPAVCVGWALKDHANCQRLAFGWPIRHRELSAAIRKAWKGYRNPLTALKVPSYAVPDISCETLPALPTHVPNTDRCSAPHRRTHCTSYARFTQPRHRTAEITIHHKKSAKVLLALHMTILPELPKKLQLRVHVSI